LPPQPSTTPFPYTTLFRSHRISPATGVLFCYLQMLQPRNLVRLRQCISYFNTPPSLIYKTHFSTSRCLRQEDNPQSPIFVPKAPDRKSTRLNSSHLGISYA